MISTFLETDMGTLLQDLRHAARRLGRSPGFTLVAVLTLALGIGANTAIFSVTSAVLFRPLPFPEPERLVMLWERSARRPEGHNVVSPANYLDWRANSHSFASTATWYDRQTTLSGLGEPEELLAGRATASLFSVLGIEPAVGRSFSSSEDAPGGAAVVVLGDGLWRRRFNADPTIVGRTITLDRKPYEVVGVMPAGFRAPASYAQLWLPLSLDPAVDYRLEAGRYLYAIGRLAPGATVEAAGQDLAAIARRLEEAHPDFNTGWTATLVPLQEQLVGGARRSLLVLAGGVGFVLLIACVNLANLQLARTAARRRELAVRAALGAGRWRLARDSLAESLLLALLGGGAGLLLAVWGVAALVAASPTALPRVHEIAAGPWTFVFAALLSIVTGVCFGLVPALRGSSTDLNPMLKEGERGSTIGRGRGTLVAMQMGLSLVLLIGAALLIRSFVRLSQVDPGFDPAGVFTARVSLPAEGYESPEKQVRFFGELLAGVKRLPGVEGASAVDWLPFAGLGSATGILIDGQPTPRPGEEPVADIRSVDPDYFRVMGISVLAGEPFTARDGPEARKAVVISRALAERYFPGENAVGRQILMPWGDTLRGEVVAVVADTRPLALDSLPRPMIYWALSQFPPSAVTLVVRSRLDAAGLERAIADQVHALDPGLALSEVRPLESYLGQTLAARRFTMVLLGGFAGLALLLAAVGIAGVTSNDVSRRVREIGVRMALGALPSDVLGMLVRQGMKYTLAGLFGGVIGALVLTRLLTSLLYGTSPTDALTFVAVPVALAIVALVATLIPARRATRVDPMTALRAE